MLPIRALRLFAAVAAITVVACSSNAPVGGTPTSLATDQTLRFPIAQELATLDPALIQSETDAAIGQNVFDGLLKFDGNMGIVPDIASAMPTVSADGTTITFKLRTDVTFSNGDPVTSADVLYSWNRAAAMQGPFATNFSAISGYDRVAANQASGAALEGLLEKKDPSVTMSGLTALDADTVEVRLTGAAGWFGAAIAQPSVAGMIVDQKIVKSDPANWWKDPSTLVGTGAFKLTAHTPDQSYDFTAVDSWWGRPRPTLKTVHVDVTGDPATAESKYQQGGFDLLGYAAYRLPATDIANLQTTERSQLQLTVKNKSYWVSFNLVADTHRSAGGPFTLDGGQAAHDLRLAFAMSVDRDKLAKTVCSDVSCAPATGGLIPRGLLGYLGDGSDPLAVYDPVKARSLLLSGDPGGTKTRGLVYVYDPENPFSEAVASFLHDQWLANLGVSVTLRPVPHSRFLSERLAGDYIMSRDGWAADYDHPQDWFDNLWGKIAGCPDITCTSGYDTKAYDQLLASADAEPLPASIPDYKTLSRQLIDDAAYIPLFYTMDALVIKPYVLGAGSNNMFDYWWNQIQLVQH